MKWKDMPSFRGQEHSRKATARLRSIRREGVELTPGRIQGELFAAFMAGYRHGRKMAKAK